MRIIHCADIHLDSKMTANLPAEKAKERRLELLLTFRRMVDFAARNQVEAIIIAGDLFDRKNSSALSRNTFTSLVRDHPDILFFYLKGNHDRNRLFGSPEEKPGNLLLFSEDNWITYPLGDTGISVTGAELTEENRKRILSSLRLNSGEYNLVVLHGQAEDSAAVFSGSEQSEAAPVISLRSLRGREIDYLALGHIHKKEAGKLDGRGIWCYPGCMEGRGFDECGDHGCILLDIDPDTHGTEISFVPLAARQFHKISVDIGTCANSYEILRAIEKKLAENCGSRDLVKVILTGETKSIDAIPTEYFEKQLEPQFYYIHVENRTRRRADYRSFASDPSLKGEFVRLVSREASLTEEEKAEVIQTGIRLLMGADELED